MRAGCRSIEDEDEEFVDMDDEFEDEEIPDLWDENDLDDMEVQSDSGSEVEENITQCACPELSDEEKEELAAMFSFFDGLTRDAVSFIHSRTFWFI